MTAKTEAEKATTAEDTKAEKPVPSQSKADAVREDAIPDAPDAAAKSKKVAANEAPYPSQADLDRIKDGTFRSRETKAAEAGANYQTR